VKEGWTSSGGLADPARRRCLAALGLAALCLGATGRRAAAQGKVWRLVALGDSLTAGYNLPPEAAFPVVLQRMLKERGWPVEVANAGVSGDTTQGGLDRLDWSVPDGTDGVIVGLGANDALRGLDPARTLANLEAIVTRLKARGVAVMLAGMRAPRNLGEAYAAAFDPIYPRLAGTHGLTLDPFFLEGVAADPKLNQSDGIHPTAEGVEAIVRRMLPIVEDFLRRMGARPATG
jgi:acyl-CoA thioesterase-1